MSRLQDEGFEVNALPTIEEIDQAKKKYLLKKELADIDPSTVLLKRPRKTLSDDDDNEKNDKNEAEKVSRDQKSQERKEKGKGDHRNGSSVGSPEREKENVSRNLGSPDKKSKLIDDNNDEEEEAEAQF